MLWIRFECDQPYSLRSFWSHGGWMKWKLSLQTPLGKGQQYDSCQDREKWPNMANKNKGFHPRLPISHLQAAITTTSLRVSKWNHSHLFGAPSLQHWSRNRPSSLISFFLSLALPLHNCPSFSVSTPWFMFHSSVMVIFSEGKNSSVRLESCR